MRRLPIALVLLLPRAALAQEAPDRVEPVPAWVPNGTGFEPRVKALADHVHRNNPTNDHRVFNQIVLVTARTGTRIWLGRDTWDDGKVRFAVGRETEMVAPLAAIKAAEARAFAALDGVSTSGSRRLLDWYISEEGVTYALVGRWRTLEEQGEAPPRGEPANPQASPSPAS